jgi:hypothetical protein
MMQLFYRPPTIVTALRNMKKGPRDVEGHRFFFSLFANFFSSTIRLLIDIQHDNDEGPPPYTITIANINTIPTSNINLPPSNLGVSNDHQNGHHHQPDMSQATATCRNGGSSNSSRRGSRRGTRDASVSRAQLQVGFFK